MKKEDLKINLTFDMSSVEKFSESFQKLTKKMNEWWQSLIALAQKGIALVAGLEIGKARLGKSYTNRRKKCGK